MPSEHSYRSDIAFVSGSIGSVAMRGRVNRDPLFFRNRLVIIRQPVAGFGLDLFNGRRHFDSRSNALQPTQHDPLRSVETLANDSQATCHRTDLDKLAAHLVVRVDDEHELLRLVRSDRRIRHQDCVVLAAARKPQPREQPRRQEPIGIGKDRPATHGPGVRIQAVVDEVHVALVAEAIFLVAQRDVHRILHIARALPLSLLRQRVYFRNACSSASK